MLVEVSTGGDPESLAPCVSFLGGGWRPRAHRDPPRGPAADLRISILGTPLPPSSPTHAHGSCGATPPDGAPAGVPKGRP